MEPPVEASAAAASHPSIEPFDPVAPGFGVDPSPVYGRYRSLDPVHFGRPAAPGHAGTWYLFRHDDVAGALRDDRFVREARTARPESRPPPMPDPYRPFWQMASKWILFRDPPDHTRLRALVSKAFTPRVVKALAPHFASIADGLIDEVEPAGALDLIADFAFPLPVVVIAELLGVPHEDRMRFKDWGAALGAAIDLRTSPDVYVRASEATGEVTEYLRAIVAARRSEPRDDLVSALIAAETNDGSLDEEELIAMCVLLLVAGHETTVNLIGNGTLALLRHRDRLELLRSQPELIDRAVEELLRFDAPIQFTFRFVGEAVELRGRTDRGEQVGLVHGSANHDPEQFADPARLDVTRSAGRHVGFGMGIHDPLLPGRAAGATRGAAGVRDATPPPPRAPARRRAAPLATGRRAPRARGVAGAVLSPALNHGAAASIPAEAGVCARGRQSDTVRLELSSGTAKVRCQAAARTSIEADTFVGELTSREAGRWPT